MSEETDKPMSKKEKIMKSVISWLPYIALPVLVYFGNVEFQSYLGRQALAEAGLPSVALEDAFVQARNENKLVLADMSAIWCPSCRKLDAEVFADEDVQNAIGEDYVFSRIEYESPEGEAFMAKYQVTGFPTLLILDPNGNKLRQLPITFSPEQFISYIKRS